MYYLGITHYDTGEKGITSLGHQGFTLFIRQADGTIAHRTDHSVIAGQQYNYLTGSKDSRMPDDRRAFPHRDAYLYAIPLSREQYLKMGKNYNDSFDRRTTLRFHILASNCHIVVLNQTKEGIGINPFKNRIFPEKIKNMVKMSKRELGPQEPFPYWYNERQESNATSRRRSGKEVIKDNEIPEKLNPLDRKSCKRLMSAWNTQEQIDFVASQCFMIVYLAYYLIYKNTTRVISLLTKCNIMQSQKKNQRTYMIRHIRN